MELKFKFLGFYFFSIGNPNKFVRCNPGTFVELEPNWSNGVALSESISFRRPMRSPMNVIAKSAAMNRSNLQPLKKKCKTKAKQKNVGLEKEKNFGRMGREVGIGMRRLKIGSRSYLKLLLFEPRTNLLQLIGQVRQRGPHQLLLVFVSCALTNQLAVSRNPVHLIGN